MKLGNKGWAINSLLIHTSILMLFFLIALFLGYRLYSSLNKKISPELKNNDVSNNLNNHEASYAELEKSIEKAAKFYVGSFYKNNHSFDTITININNLVNENLLKQPKDLKTKKDCIGYVLVKTDEEINAYLKCSEYTTKGFQEWRME